MAMSSDATHDVTTRTNPEANEDAKSDAVFPDEFFARTSGDCDMGHLDTGRESTDDADIPSPRPGVLTPTPLPSLEDGCVISSQQVADNRSMSGESVEGMLRNPALMTMVIPTDLAQRFPLMPGVAEESIGN